MKNNEKVKYGLISIWQFVIFFLLVAFVVSVSFLLFFSGEDIPYEVVRARAGLTFINVIFLSLLITFVDFIRRKYTIGLPVRRILEATHQITKGDFSVRIEPFHTGKYKNEFDQIIEDFNRMADELSGIETLRTDFIGNVSHELKTPLAVIHNYATMLQETQLLQEKRIEYAKILTGASKRLSDLITNILKLNKLENQRIYPETKRFNLSDQLCECLIGYEDIWEKKELEIDTDIDEDVFIEAAPELLVLVWNNLFSNAIKFTHTGGKVFVSLKTKGNTAIVKITDTGCGISKEIGNHIFEKFYQGDTSHSSEGNGLGLALVKRVVDIMGSEVYVESEVGKGSTFTVKIKELLRWNV